MFEKCSETDVFCTFLLHNVVFATSSCNFVDIRTPKSASERTCFVHFHFQMCFSPQRRAIFRHQNFKKCSDTVSFLAFSLPNVLFATAACNFWFLLWAPTSAPAALTGLLLDWPDTRIIEKTQHFATSPTFGADVSSFFWLSRYCIFFLLTWLLYSAFQLSILSEVCYLNFLRLVQYDSVLQSTTPESTSSSPVLQSTNPVLLPTTKYYSSTTKYYSSTTSYYKVLVQYYFVLQSTSPVLLRTTKYYSSTTSYYKVLRDRSDHNPTISDHNPTTKTQTATRLASEVTFRAPQEHFLL